MAELPSQAEIRAVARELLRGALDGAEGPGAAFVPPRGARELVNASQVMAAKDKGVLIVPAGSIVTPLAHDAAESAGVQIRFADGSSAGGAAPTPARPWLDAPGSGSGGASAAAHAEGPEPSPLQLGGPVALGSDHGGFKLKEALKRHLASRGLTVLDQGTTSDAACDYPDLAARVGRAVSLGEARWGVFVDGAGIGGAMALNKVPGVFAATCHDPKAAQNARGHNSANVLCLGSGWVDEERARAVVDAFFGTGFEAGRHLRRVHKIHAIERAFLARGNG